MKQNIFKSTKEQYQRTISQYYGGFGHDDFVGERIC